MNLILVTLSALALSMGVIPLMVALAPRLGLLDQPDPRKVHAVAMPRVGGWGIVLGALLPPLFWLPLEPLVQAFLFGGLVLFAMGAWDDARGLSATAKLLAQVVAVTPAVLYADLLVTRGPFLGGGEIPHLAAVMLTYLGLVGMINATNLSDGLDGLAGGEALLSLLAVALLAYRAEEGALVLVLATASMGGILGFLRFNTYPAQLFMGDSGSQFLGFAAAFLVILLSQEVNQAMSAVAPLLILGLPIIDVVLVFSERLARGVSPFRPMRNHIHHRLLDLGLGHNQTVVVIYAVQAAMVSVGAFMCYAADLALFAWYLALGPGLVAGILWAQTRRGRAGNACGSPGGVAGFRRRGAGMAGCAGFPGRALRVVVPLVLVAFSVGVTEVPRDFAVMSGVLGVVLALEFVLRRSHGSVTLRGVMYATAVFVAHLSVSFPPVFVPYLGVLEVALYGAIVAGVAVAMRRSEGSGAFQTTPMDYLILFVVLALGGFTQGALGDATVSAVVVKSFILLYGAEILLNSGRAPWSGLTVATLVALGVLAWRGL